MKRILLLICAVLFVGCSTHQYFDYFGDHEYRYVGSKKDGKIDGTVFIMNEYGKPIVRALYKDGVLLHIDCNSSKGEMISISSSRSMGDEFSIGNKNPILFNKSVSTSKQEIQYKWFKVPTIKRCFDLQ